VFELKKDAEEACRRFLYKYEPGSVVDEFADELFLLDLLYLHPDKDAKIGCGIERFEVRQNPKFPRQRSLYLVRNDGTETDFSFVKCLRPPTHRQMVLEAMRQEVFPQVFNFSESAYTSVLEVPCAITGVMLPRGTAHVDHSAPTFVELAEEFVAQRNGWDAFMLARADGSIGVQLADPEQAQAWRDYHREKARLRMVSIQANLSLLRRGIKRRR
jgi:hypothetical protein